MRWPDELLERSERLVNALIDIEGTAERTVSAQDALAIRLDVLERLIELLRLRSGRIENTLTMNDLLGRGVSVEALAPYERALVTVHAHAGRPQFTSYRTHPELHAALLVHLLHARTRRGHIGDDLHAFVLSVGNDLGPDDVESTRTGVMRIATTTRDAARTLRHWGLLRDSDETRNRMWQLSVLGILTAVELSASMPKIELPTPGGGGSSGRFGHGQRLSETVEDVVRQFHDESRVRAALLALCERDREVFHTFDSVVKVLADFCGELDARCRALDARDPVRNNQGIQRAANAMLQTVEAAVPPGVLAEDVNKSLAFDQLPGLERPSLS